MRTSFGARVGALCLVLSMGCDGKGPTVSGPAAAEPTQRADALAAAVPKLSAAEWLATLPNAPPPSRPLPFDVQRADYYPEVMKALKLTAEEQALLAKNGFVIVDHDQRYTFASAYLGVYTRDLPVLVTTDSILHAYHRSYDAVLRSLEEQWMSPALERLLGSLRGRLAEKAKAGKVDATAVRDLDAYLRVALALLADPEQPAFEKLSKSYYPDDAVPEIVEAAIEAERGKVVRLREHPREIDFTQFTPRGHYTRSPQLSRYFRAMMWLGRSDTGFWLTAGDPELRIDVDADRELRAAALLSELLVRSNAVGTYRDVDALYALFVGKSDNLTVDALAEASLHAKGSIAVMRSQLEQHPDAEQRIQSSIHRVKPGSPGHAQLPMLFQLFGQRFTIDAHVLHELVHDRLVVDGKAVRRMMPSPLDVAAALGNDEAARLLEPELARHGYAGKLNALRREIEVMPESAWSESLSTGWLAALRTLHPGGVAPGSLPRAMDSTAWQHKMLATELASWSELRHDNVLVTKESYGMGVTCEYPYGYVEPYPAFYARMAGLAESTKGALSSHVNGELAWLGRHAAEHFEKFAKVMRTLEGLANKELRAQPFDKDEQDFLKQVAFNAPVGCGGPELSGWYASLYFMGEDPQTWEPTVAAVHTTPIDGHLEMLHVGVGDTRYMVAVLDSQEHVRTYVGPVYSYYETVEQDTRLTDEAWRAKLLSNKRPRVPAWFSALGGKPQKRELGPPAKQAE